jgi:hypothetical protein
MAGVDGGVSGDGGMAGVGGPGASRRLESVAILSEC